MTYPILGISRCSLCWISCGILPEIYPDIEFKSVGARIKQLRNMDLVGRDVFNAVTDIERAIVTARAHGAH